MELLIHNRPPMIGVNVWRSTFSTLKPSEKVADQQFQHAHSVGVS
jgi:hypothetical protein